MAGIHADHTVHRVVSGESPAVGLRVYTNNLDQGTIVQVADDPGCGWYCNAWHTVEVDLSYTGETISPPSKQMFNCDRLSTRKPN